MPAGRPTKYRPEYCGRIIELMTVGLSKEAAAADIGIVKQTLYNWAEEFPEFMDAIKVGEAKSLLFWEKLGIQGAAGQVVNFNATAWVFNMKNRHEWRDKHEVTGNMNMSHRVNTYLPENGRTEPDGD